jgi:hypothetical protein
MSMRPLGKEEAPVDIKQFVSGKAEKAKAASRALANISTEIKNNALFKMAAGLEKESAKLISENRKDLAEAEKQGLSKAMIDRLTLTHDRIKAMADGLREVAALPDPVGDVVRGLPHFEMACVPLGASVRPTDVVSRPRSIRPPQVSRCSTLRECPTPRKHFWRERRNRIGQSSTSKAFAHIQSQTTIDSARKAVL